MFDELSRKLEGVLKQYAFIKGAFRDMKCYAILKQEY